MQQCSCYQQGRRGCWGALSLLLILTTSALHQLCGCSEGCSSEPTSPCQPATAPPEPELRNNKQPQKNKHNGIKHNIQHSRCCPAGEGQPAPRDLKGITNRMIKCKDFGLFKWILGLSSILSSEQCTETTHILILLSLISINTEKRGVFLVKNDAPTFNVTLWSLRPCRMLVPLPIRSSMPRWALCRDSLNCKVSSIGMVVSESCGESRDSVTCSLRNTTCTSRHCKNPTGLGGLCLNIWFSSWF